MYSFSIFVYVCQLSDFFSFHFLRAPWVFLISFFVIKNKKGNSFSILFIPFVLSFSYWGSILLRFFSKSKVISLYFCTAFPFEYSNSFQSYFIHWKAFSYFVYMMNSLFRRLAATVSQYRVFKSKLYRRQARIKMLIYKQKKVKIYLFSNQNDYWEKHFCLFLFVL